jgi:hypothetical protein
MRMYDHGFSSGHLLKAHSTHIVRHCSQAPYKATVYTGGYQAFFPTLWSRYEVFQYLFPNFYCTLPTVHKTRKQWEFFLNVLPHLVCLGFIFKDNFYLDKISYMILSFLSAFWCSQFISFSPHTSFFRILVLNLNENIQHFLLRKYISSNSNNYHKDWELHLPISSYCSHCESHTYIPDWVRAQSFAGSPFLLVHHLPRVPRDLWRHDCWRVHVQHRDRWMSVLSKLVAEI